jgi:hypothetical protein
LTISANFQLFIRVASVNAKGLILSDFYIVHHSLSNTRFIPKIDRFQCSSDEQNQRISLQWSIDDKSRLYIEKYVLYYSDLTENNNDLIRMLTIPINRQSYKYEFNLSSFQLNNNPSHILRLHLAIIDQDQNQLPMASSPIYCTFTRKSGKNDKHLFSQKS